MLYPDHYPRPDQVEAIKDIIRRKQNVVVHGPPRQGKTSRLLEAIDGEQVLYIECRPGFKRTHIYRLILSSLGYSMSVSNKRNAKLGVKLSIPGTSISGEGGTTTERVFQEVTIDLKNASEVAHVISRIQQPPIVVLNAFHMLNADTMVNLLMDIAFYSERSNLRFIIVGSWNDVDHLESIEPSIAGKLHYVQIPYWSVDQLRLAHSWICEHRNHPPLSADRLDRILDLSGGDISLLAELTDIAPGISAEAFQAEAARLSVARSRRGLETRLGQFLSRRAFSLYYSTVDLTLDYQTNTKFTRNPAGSRARYRTTTIDPATGNTYPDGRKVRLDADGNPEFRLVAKGEFVRRGVYFGRFLLESLHAAARDNLDRLSVKELSQAMVDQLLSDGVAVDVGKIAERIQELGETQRKELIMPPLIAVDPVAGTIAIADRRLFITLASMQPEELADWMELILPEDNPSPRRSALVSTDVAPDDQERIAAQRARQSMSGAAASDEAGAADDTEEEDEEEDDGASESGGSEKPA